MSLHDDAVVVDGLNVSNFTPAVLEAMRRGGVTAANCTCCVWEDFATTLQELGRWYVRFSELSETIMQVRAVDDIARAKSEGRVGIVLGWQNSSGFDDTLPYVSLFADLGLRVVQLTYNTANSAGAGCYERHDPGLTDFGRSLVGELNRAGILIDLSHVGRRTAADAIRASARPVAYTHVAPAALREHPRNKTDDELRLIAEHGGFVGVTFFPPFLRRGAESTLDDYLDAVEHIAAVVGEANVGLGSDMTEAQPPEFFDYITREHGHGRKLVELGTTYALEELQSAADFPKLTAAMERRGWSERRIRAFLGENWVRLLARVWR